MTATGPKECPSPRASARQDRRMAPAGAKGSITGNGADFRVLGGWSGRSRSTGLSPSRLEVNSAARMSPVAASMARWTLRCWRRHWVPCILASHSPSPRTLMPVLSKQTKSEPRRFSAAL